MTAYILKLVGGCITAVLVCGLLKPSTAFADPPDISGRGASDAYEIVGQRANEASGSVAQTAGEGAGSAGGSAPAFVEYRWLTVCVGIDSASGSTGVECAAARSCAEPAERLFRLWGREEGAGWSPLATRCFGETPTVADVPQPTVTPALVLEAIREIGLPTLQAETQPADKTLVNFATIFYTEPQQFTRTVTLLGQSVDIEATPGEYTWHHGDGTTVTTSSPGAPYPSKEITHYYSDAHVTVAASVDVTYTARFRVSGGSWQGIDETVTIPGPPTALRISEATALLSGEYE